MTTSIFPKTPVTTLPVASGNGIGGSSVVLPLNKDELTAEHIVTVEVTQTFTTAPTGFDQFKVLDKLRFDTGSQGTTIDASFENIIESNRWYEAPIAARSTLGLTSTAIMTFDIHHEMDGALADLVSALESGEMDVADLQLFFPVDTASCFTGGAGAGSATYRVTVHAERLSELTAVGHMEFLQDENDEFYLDKNGEPISNPYYLVGQDKRVLADKQATGATTGKQPAFMLKTGNLTRGLQLIAKDNTGARSDDVIENIRIVVGSNTIKSINFKQLQAMNEAKRGLALVGTGKALVDFGDVNNAWLDLRGVNEAFLEYDVNPAYAGGTWSVSMAQDAVESVA